jgi:hypothetical protein
MMNTMRTLKGLGIGLVAAASLTACAQTPREIHASNPTVTYNYRTDQELLQANQNASSYCAQYQTAPRTRTVTNNADGTRTVVFECVGPVSPTVASTTTTTTVVPPPGMRYTYRSDQELIQASQTASARCGTYPMTSTIVTNADGSRTVTFSCPPR